MHLQPPTVDSAAGFELPLVAIEHYMLADDRDDYPMAFFVRLSLDRLPQRQAWEQAVVATLPRHPLLGATLGPTRGRRRNWVWNRSVRPETIWPGDASNQAPLDLNHQAGLRIHAEQLADGARLTLEFHHACCDGLGALKFVQDLLAAYQAQVEQGAETGGTAAPSQLPERVLALRKRGRCGVGPIRFILRLPLELLGALGVAEFLWHRPEPLGGSGAGSVEPTNTERETTPGPERYSHEFTADETRAMRTVAAQSGATLNDLLVRDLFLTVGQWIDERKPSRRGAHVRVMVPVNLRTDSEKDLSAANVVAMINLDRRPRRWHNQRRMLRVLHWEMGAVKWARLGLTFIRAIQATHYLLGKLQILLAEDKCQATCVLSNLGNPWRKSPLAGPDGRVVAGDVTVRQVEMLPPIRPLTRVSIGAISYAGRLTIALHCDRRVLTDDECNALLSRYVASLQRSLS